MELVHSVEDLKKHHSGSICLALGNFDGVHAGHREILRKTVALAAEKGLKSAALIFIPHPQSVLFPNRPPDLLQPVEDRIKMLGETGIDYVIRHPFTREFAAITPQQFVSEIICGKIAASCVVVGFNYTFGRYGSGTAADLKRYGKLLGFDLHIIDPVIVGGRVVGSSAIRELLAEGKVEEASLLLERPFYLRGTVVHGDGRGRRLGFPTANLKVSKEIMLPSNGVYLTKASSGLLKAWLLTNIGVRPTFGKKERSIEVYLFDLERDLYNKELKVCFITKIRNEMAFPDSRALACRIKKDIATAKSIIKNAAPAKKQNLTFSC